MKDSVWWVVNLVVAKTDMGKPPSKASEGGDCDILWVREDFTKSEVQHVSAMHVLICLKVRSCESGTARSQSEASPTGFPMSVYQPFLQH